MQRRFYLHDNRIVTVLFLALSSAAFIGCEPPPVADWICATASAALPSIALVATAWTAASS